MAASDSAAPEIRPLAWLRSYDRAFLRGDLVAGVTLASYVLPVALAYASLAGLPPQAGLYSCMRAALGFALFCTSRRTAVATTSAISLLLGTTLGGMAGGEPARFAALASATALYVAAVCLLARLLGAGGVTQFMSDVVLTGFKVGAALTIATTQLPKLLGVAGGGEHFFGRLAVIVEQLPTLSPATLAVGIASIVLLVLGARRLPGVPVSLLVVAASILVMSLVDPAALGVRVLGSVPAGLPSLALPVVRPEDFNQLLPLALACFLLATVETMAVSRVFAARHGERFDANRDLVAIGVANLAAGVFQGYPVSGGMSQSAVAESAGARTPATLIVASIVLGLVTTFLSGLLRDLPQAVLAAVVLVAVSGLIDVPALQRIYRFSKEDFLVAALAMVGVLASGLLRGVLLASVFSLVLLIRRASRPYVAVLGRAPGSGWFGDLARDPQNEEIPRTLIVRVSGAIVYFNAEVIGDQIAALARQRGADLRLVVIALGMVPMVDLAGSDMLTRLHADLAAHGVGVDLAEAHGQVRDALAAAGAAEKFPGLGAGRGIAEAIAEHEGELAKVR